MLTRLNVRCTFKPGLHSAMGRPAAQGRFEPFRHRKTCIREHVPALLVMYQQPGVL
jgi:hypothetical protein